MARVVEQTRRLVALWDRGRILQTDTPRLLCIGRNRDLISLGTTSILNKGSGVRSLCRTPFCAAVLPANPRLSSRGGGTRTHTVRILSPKTCVLACPSVSGNSLYLRGYCRFRAACFSGAYSPVLARLQYGCSTLTTQDCVLYREHRDGSRISQWKATHLAEKDHHHHNGAGYRRRGDSTPGEQAGANEGRERAHRGRRKGAGGATDTGGSRFRAAM